jgi:small subunit ribosomal protein S8
MFNRIRNAIQARKRTVSIPASKLLKEITRILFENHFIAKYAFVEDGNQQGQIKILLKYDDNMRNAIQGIERISTSGRRHYASVDETPKVLGGMGIAIMSTSKGLLTDRQCRQNNVGGELIAKVW